MKKKTRRRRPKKNLKKKIQKKRKKHPQWTVFYVGNVGVTLRPLSFLGMMQIQSDGKLVLFPPYLISFVVVLVWSLSFSWLIVP